MNEQTGGIEKIHYIFMLDYSGSMAGSKWNSVMNCVSDFMNSVESDINKRDNTKVSVIGYCSHS